MQVTMTGMTIPQLEEAILQRKKEMNAVILAHYYQEDDIQDIADYVGDSLDLARRAAATDAEAIIFCGVKFMAEGAKILNPSRKVILPDLEAGCSLETSCPPADFKAFRAAHPDHIAVTYINCSADVKALSDIIVTSTNAESILRQIPPQQKIIFAPDKHLGAYLSKKMGREMLCWDGSCMVHARFSEVELVKLREQYPQARVIAHPECPQALLAYAEFVGSTSALLKYTAQHPANAFIVLTEPGIIHQMRQQSPGSVFYTAPFMEQGGACVSCNNCPYMKLNTMEKLYQCMVNGGPEIHLPDALMDAARKPLQRMLEMSAAIPASGIASAVKD
jgi:quinolinate synthase